jgi:hypothetical protein
MALGLFARQIVGFPKITDWNPENLRWQVATSAFAVALALFPPVMVWLNKNRRRPSWEHLVFAYSFGFFGELLHDRIAKFLLSSLGWI